MFYGPMMTGMNRWGIVQAIGANCVFRREALRSIGGHAAGLAEDMHTAMRLHAYGWKGIYVPATLTRGQVPSTLAAYYKQQLKWSCGCYELLFQRYPKLWRGFTLANKIHYFLTPLHYLRGFVSLIDFLIPILCLALGGIVFSVRVESFVLHYLPVLLAVQLVRIQAQRWLADRSERGLYLVGGALKTGSWWIYVLGTLCALLRVKIPYLPTPKGEAATDAWTLALPNLLLATLSIAAIAYGLNYDWSPYSLAMAGFAAWNAMVLIFCAAIGQQRSFEILGKFSPVFPQAMIRLRPALQNLASALRARVTRFAPQAVLLLATFAAIPVLEVLVVTETSSNLLPPRMRLAATSRPFEVKTEMGQLQSARATPDPFWSECTLPKRIWAPSRATTGVPKGNSARRSGLLHFIRNGGRTVSRRFLTPC